MSRTRIVCIAIVGVAVAAPFLGLCGEFSASSSTEQPKAQKAENAKSPHLGTWKRDVHHGVVLHFEPDRLRVTLVKDSRGQKGEIDLQAEYSTSKDKIIYGLVISATARYKAAGLMVPPPAESDEESTRLERQLIDSPLCIRYRVDGDILVVKDFRMWEMPDGSYLTGRYTRQ